MKQKITVLGSTGSIGTNTLDVVARHPEQYEIFALSASTQVDLMLRQCVQFKPRFAVMASAPHAQQLAEGIKQNGLVTQVLQAQDALEVIASHPDVDAVMAAIVGAAGLAPCLAAAKAGKRLMPAGAIYYNMDERDVQRVLRYPLTMVGSDGLPNDPMPHPRLWGAFPRVLGHYSRDEQLFPLTEAVHKMTGMSAARFQLAERGLIKCGYFADLVLFDPQTVRDVASFSDPQQPAAGIDAVMVNGVMSYGQTNNVIGRAGRFLRR